MLIRFPLEIENKPKKRRVESWPNVIGGGLIILSVILILIFIIVPMVGEKYEHERGRPGGASTPRAGNATDH